MTRNAQDVTSRRRRIVMAVIGLFVMTAIISGYCYKRHGDYKHFAVHHDGRVYRSGWMTPSALRDVIERHQIRTVVNLCEPTEMSPDDWKREREAVTKSGARVLEIPMPLTTKLDDGHISRFVAVLGNSDNYPMLIHCQHGVTRTAKLLAIYDIAYRELSADESLRAMPLFGRKDQNVHVRAFARNFENQYRTMFPNARPTRLTHSDAHNDSTH